MESNNDGLEQATELATTLRQEGDNPPQMVFFPDSYGKVFAWIRTTDDDAHFECLPVRSRAFRSRFLKQVRQSTGTLPQPSIIKKAIEIIELNAYTEQKRILDLRRKMVGPNVLIDLADSAWRCIEVGQAGWKIKIPNGPLFYRTQQQLPITEPIEGGDAMELFTFVPADTKEEKLLILVWALAVLYPQIPIPILMLIGAQGSAKTTRSLRIKGLLDPSLIPCLGEIEMSNLPLSFYKTALLCFENVGRFTAQKSDMFCRAVTGDGIEKRELYTDSEQVLFKFQRPIIINGIALPSVRPDFLDRCLIINCNRRKEFVPRQELDQQFEAARPRLLGALLDLLVKTLRLLGDTPKQSEFRMSDFAYFGRAVARALGKSSDDFDQAYRLNLRHQDFEILEDAPMTGLLRDFASGYSAIKPWTGIAEALLKDLRFSARQIGDTDALRDLPKSPRWLSTRLGELKSALATEGIQIEKLPRSNSHREWKLYSGSVQATADLADAVRHRMDGGSHHE